MLFFIYVNNNVYFMSTDFYLKCHYITILFFMWQYSWRRCFMCTSFYLHFVVFNDE